MAFVSRAVIADLLALQKLDDDLVRIQAECDALRKKLETDRTAELRSAVTYATRQLAVRELTLRDAESVLEDTVVRLKRHESRLYGEGATPKELGALQAEIAHLNAAKRTQEDQILAAMMASETASQHMAALQEQLRALETQQTADRKVDAESLASQQAHLEEVRSRRTAQASSISTQTLAKYEQLRRTKAGVAIAQVRQNVCMGCHVNLAPANLQRARNSAELVPCDNCGRILAVL